MRRKPAKRRKANGNSGDGSTAGRNILASEQENLVLRFVHSKEARIETSSASATGDFGTRRDANIHKGERDLFSVRR